MFCLLAEINILLLLCMCRAALGQVLLYVDGMNGVIAHNNTVQWLYTLINSAVSISLCCLAFVKIALSVYEVNSALIVRSIKISTNFEAFYCLGGIFTVIIVNTYV